MLINIELKRVEHNFEGVPYLKFTVVYLILVKYLDLTVGFC